MRGIVGFFNGKVVGGGGGGVGGEGVTMCHTHRSYHVVEEIFN